MRKPRKRLLLAVALISAAALIGNRLFRQAGRDGPARGARIAEVQGAAHVSPLMGQRVIDVPGVVTAVLKNGFFMQDPEGDDLPETSEGLFVFTSAAPEVGAGDHVAVNGRVVEFYPGGKESGNLPTTQIAWALLISSLSGS